MRSIKSTGEKYWQVLKVKSRLNEGKGFSKFNSANRRGLSVLFITQPNSSSFSFIIECILYFVDSLQILNHCCHA